MQIELRLKAASDFATRAYNSDEDDVRSILIDVCRAAGSQSEFVFSGFGQQRWPVDVGTDLPVFLEQLPSALRAVNQKMTAAVGFYEQGIQRSIMFEPSGRRYIATCASQTDWQPNPVTEDIPGEELADMLLAAREAFMSVLAEMAPDLAKHPWIRNWLRGLE
jgi:hypothetical protein